MAQWQFRQLALDANELAERFAAFLQPVGQHQSGSVIIELRGDRLQQVLLFGHGGVTGSRSLVGRSFGYCTRAPVCRVKLAASGTGEEWRDLVRHIQERSALDAGRDR